MISFDLQLQVKMWRCIYYIIYKIGRETQRTAWERTIQI